MNIQVCPGLIIAVPKDKSIDSEEFFKIFSFPQKIFTNGEELIKVDLRDFAWAAYDPGLYRK